MIHWPGDMDIIQRNGAINVYYGGYFIKDQVNKGVLLQCHRRH